MKCKSARCWGLTFRLIRSIYARRTSKTRLIHNIYIHCTLIFIFQTSCLFCLAGTESGHAAGEKSHASGYKLDIRLNDGVNSYIKTNYTDVGKRRDGAHQYKSPEGYVFAKEGDHWDILFPWVHLANHLESAIDYKTVIRCSRHWPTNWWHSF